MSRIHRDDISQWIDHNIFRPTKTLLLSGEINSSMLELAIKGLTILDSTRHEVPIQILLNSEGGDVTAGLAIMNLIEQCTSEVHITVIGEAESMAAWILQAADVRRAHADATIMIHVGEYSLASNHPLNNKERLRQFEVQEHRLLQILADKLHMTTDVVDELIRFDRIYLASEALEMGLIDEVVE